ncbi:hypothetical protein NFI96_009675 [Prochilodus magdalenae]|nr:hypothetical protein NFI96_009675 [Prochilodus magdalenae]
MYIDVASPGALALGTEHETK